ncbi:hypothetical protein TNCV_4061251 [Trichonephila clavipes]|nr:hypothetical protein TNCV_4061251 [Trichonephila clavipes]
MLSSSQKNEWFSNKGLGILNHRILGMIFRMRSGRGRLVVKEFKPLQGKVRGVLYSVRNTESPMQTYVLGSSVVMLNDVLQCTNATKKPPSKAHWTFRGSKFSLWGGVEIGR